jgi:hypothetical protein
MNKISLSIILLSGMLAWQCSKQISPVGQQSLKASLNTGTQNLNSAVAEISQTYGYKVLSLNDNSTLKSTFSPEAAFQDSITLAKIKGVYEYQPVTYSHWCYNCFTKLFTRTGDSNDLIVKLPEAKVFFPARFQSVTPGDSSLKNNLVIDASDYHYYFSMGFLWDYKLAAGLTLNDTAIGDINIQTARSSYTGYSYGSSFMFPGGYSIAVNVTSGDTATSSIALSNSTSTLFKETVNRYKVSTSKFHEREYILDVGNVEFKKAAGTDSISVYVGGALQTMAKIEVIDSNVSTGSIFSGRDIKVTFDDGTSATLSSLLGPSFTVLSGMVVNLQNVYFATNMVNYIAFNIFKNQTP